MTQSDADFELESARDREAAFDSLFEEPEVTPTPAGMVFSEPERGSYSVQGSSVAPRVDQPAFDSQPTRQVSYGQAASASQSASPDAMANARGNTVVSGFDAEATSVMSQSSWQPGAGVSDVVSGATSAMPRNAWQPGDGVVGVSSGATSAIPGFQQGAGAPGYENFGAGQVTASGMPVSSVSASYSASSAFAQSAQSASTAYIPGSAPARGNAPGASKTAVMPRVQQQAAGSVGSAEARRFTMPTEKGGVGRLVRKIVKTALLLFVLLVVVSIVVTTVVPQFTQGFLPDLLEMWHVDSLGELAQAWLADMGAQVSDLLIDLQSLVEEALNQ